MKNLDNLNVYLNGRKIEVLKHFVIYFDYDFECLDPTIKRESIRRYMVEINDIAFTTTYLKLEDNTFYIETDLFG